MVNWTEEDVKFVCNTMIVPAMERMMEFVNTAYDSNQKSIEAVISGLDRVSTRQAKEISFLKSVIVKCCHLDQNKLNLAREEYFRKYDELIKEKNNEVNTH